MDMCFLSISCSISKHCVDGVVSKENTKIATNFIISICFCYQQFFILFFSHITQHNIQNITKQNKTKQNKTKQQTHTQHLKVQ